jgi:ABC-type antimicrobial peptide transport system permease subunit
MILPNASFTFVSEKRLHWQNNLGGTLRLFADSIQDCRYGMRQLFQLIGVVNDAVYQSLRDGMQPTIYLSPLFSNISISIRAANRPSAALAQAVADALTRVDSDISFTFNVLADQVNASLARERAIAKLSAWFGTMALVLASIGLYGVMSYAVSRRRTEIGIRIALGATSSGLIRMVFRRAYVLVALGMGIGIVASL